MAKSQRIPRLKPEKEISRRQFLKSAGLVVGGAAVASLSLAAACSQAPATTPATTSSKTSTPATNPIPTTNTTSSTQPPSNTTSGTGTTPPSTSTHLYVPPTENPGLIAIDGCTTKVADDRLYSKDHTWILPIGGDRVVVGITDKMQLLLGLIELGDAFYLEPIGTVVNGGDFLANIEGYKMNVDLLSPVSGAILDVNDALYADPGILGSDPYLKGWLFVIELSKPGELDDMISPEEYAALQVPA